MGDRKVKGKVMYTGEQQPQQQQQQQGQPQQSQPQSQQQQQQAVQTQHAQTVTMPPRIIYGKQMPVAVQQDLQQQNVRIIYAQPSPMHMQLQVQGDSNVRTAYVLTNPPGTEVTGLKTERPDGSSVHQQLQEQNVRIIYAQAPMQVQMQHLGLNAIQVQDGSLLNRGEQVVCEVDLRQYQQMQAAAHHVIQAQPAAQQHSTDDQMRSTVGVMTTQYQQIQHVDQSQQTSHLSMLTNKKEKVLLPCMQCKDSFRTPCQLQAHIRNKHIKPFKCDNCWKAFSFESQLKLHVTTHTGEKPYKCDVCPKAYARKTALFNHVRVHARKKFFKCCKYCGKGFKNEEKLEKHERMHSMSDERKYVTLEMFVDKPV